MIVNSIILAFVLTSFCLILSFLYELDFILPGLFYFEKIFILTNIFFVLFWFSNMYYSTLNLF